MNHILKITLTCLFVISTTTNIAAEREANPVKDLRYGEALYHFYQEHYFSAITHLMVAKDRNPIIKQDADPELLLGGLYLYYGLHQKAGNIFSTLIKNKVTIPTQDRAWFNIGKMSYRDQLFTQAQHSLSKIQDSLTPEREAERQNMLANTYLHQKNYVAAYDSLKKLKTHQDWKFYAQYNMGISLIKTGENKQGTELLDQISILKTEDPELKALRDKANVALGYANIRIKQPQIASRYLEKVRLKGPMSAKALLGIGWSNLQQNKFEQALIPWMELRAWPVVDTAVQESLIAIPYTLELMGKNQLALKHYNYALSNYKKELTSISRALDAIKSGDLLFALKPSMVTENALAPEYLSQLPESISAAYISHLLTDIDFQKEHKNYLDLIFLQKNLLKWKNQFPAFNLMLKERRKYHTTQKKSTKKDSRLTQIHSLKRQRDKLFNKIEDIKNKHNYLALTTDEEKETLNDLGKVKYLLRRLNKNNQFSEQNNKYKFLHGLMIWDISTDFQPRYWKAKNELNQLDKAIKETMLSLKSINQSSNTAPRALTRFKQRIKQNQTIHKNLLKKINKILLSQEKLIEKKAVHSLKQRQQQIKNYYTRANYSLARLHDRLTLPEINSLGKTK